MGCAGSWLHGLNTLPEQRVSDEEVLVLKKKYFVYDANVDQTNPFQLHFVYIQV